MKILNIAAAAAGLSACAALIYTLKDSKNRAKQDVFCSCHRPQLPEGFTVTGHTGCMGTKPNSLDSICASAEFKADITEVDLRFDKDGTPVLWHDATLPERVVTLEKAFELLGELDGLKMNIDVKETDYLEKIPPLAEKYGVLDRIFFTGIGKDEVAAAKQKCPQIPYYLNYGVSTHAPDDTAYFEKIIAMLRETGAVGLNTNMENVSLSLVQAIQKAGYTVSVWTPTKKSDLQRIALCCPDNITTRNPRLANDICR